MKKVLIAILVVAIIATGGILIYMKSQSPEKQILGKWEGSHEIGSFEFKEDGAVTIGISKLSADGTYSINKDTSELSITYSLLGISYTRTYDFLLEDNVLTLTDQTLTNVQLVYSRVTE